MQKSESKLILVIDDEESIAENIADFLEDAGFETITANDGQSGLDLFHERSPAAIFCDLHMPVMEGTEVLKVVNEKSPRTPFIVVSGTGQIQTSIEASRLGAWDFILKPITDMSLLLHILEKNLERAHLLKENEAYRLYLEEEVERRTQELKDKNRQLFETRKKLAFHIQHTPLGTIEVDENCHVLEWNKSAEKIFGYTQIEIIGKDLVEVLIPEELRPQLKDEMCSLLDDKKPKVKRIKNCNQRGDLLICDWYITPLLEENGSLIAIAALILDVTQRVKAREELKLLNAQLEEKVRLRTRELENSLNSLKAAQKQLVETEKMASLGGLVMGVAHELNTPVGICLTSASYMSDQIQKFQGNLREDAISKQKFEKFMEALVESSRIVLKNLNRSAQLVESFKNLLDDADDQCKVLKLKKTLETLVFSFQSKLSAAAVKVALECSEQIEICVIPQVLFRIVNNLISNSLVHGFAEQNGGEIRIVVGQNKRQIVLEYHDNGRGLSLDEQKNIFEPFYTTRRSFGNTGLGMHSVYNLVTQKLKGQIRCEGERGKGVHIFIEFPHNLP